MTRTRTAIALVVASVVGAVLPLAAAYADNAATECIDVADLTAVAFLGDDWALKVEATDGDLLGAEGQPLVDDVTWLDAADNTVAVPPITVTVTTIKDEEDGKGEIMAFTWALSQEAIDAGMEVLAVVVKSGTGTEAQAAYPDGATSDTNAIPTVGDSGVSHITFCLGVDDGGGSIDDCTATPTLPECLEPLTLEDADAEGDPNQVWQWDIEKDTTDADDTVKGLGTVTINYTVSVTPLGYVLVDLVVTGSVTVGNPNAVDVDLGANELSIETEDGTDCTIDDELPVTVPAADSATITYTCLVPDVTVTQAEITEVDDALDHLPVLVTATIGEEAIDADVPWIFTESNVFNVTPEAADAFNGLDPTTIALTDDGDGTYSATYSQTVSVTTGCTPYENVASVLDAYDDSETLDDADVTAIACGPAATGGHTMGFWQNNNGQRMIKTAAYCSELRDYLRTFNPFSSLSSTASCIDISGFVTGVIKSASAKGAAMNAMLRGQMLATALSVFFTDGDHNLIGGPADLGDLAIDLTQVCKVISSCDGNYEDVGAAFNGATSMTVSDMLSWAATQSSLGGALWYGNLKATQALAKDAFDAINNRVAFAA